MRLTSFQDMGLPQRGFFSPVQIPNCALWLDAADASTITQVAGAVSQWNDKSGNGNNATQGTGAIQPTTNSVTMNGLNAISFNGTSNYMILPSGLYGITNGNNTIFASFKLSSAAGDQRLLSGSNNGASSNLMMRINADFEFRDSNSAGTAIKSITPNTSSHVVSMNTNGTTTSGYYDGGTPATATAATVTATSLFIGQSASTGSYIKGAIQDIIFYSRQLTNTEINNIGNFLAARSGATWTNI